MQYLLVLVELSIGKPPQEPNGHSTSKKRIRYGLEEVFLKKETIGNEFHNRGWGLNKIQKCLNFNFVINPFVFF